MHPIAEHRARSGGPRAEKGRQWRMQPSRAALVMPHGLTPPDTATHFPSHSWLPTTGSAASLTGCAGIRFVRRKRRRSARRSRIAVQEKPPQVLF